MNNDQQQTMMAFIQWLPQNAQQFEGSIPKDIIDPIAAAQSPEEVVNVLNQLSQSQEGTQIVSVMFQAFQESQKAGMFAKGGKLGQLLNKYQSGGSASLKPQTPANRKELKWANIIDSFGRTGKAAKYISPDGKSEITEFLMSDDNPDIPGYTNDVRLKVKRNPQTGEISREPLDSLTSTKILPGIWLPGIPTKWQGDAPLVRGGFRRIK